jgi:arylsulfatase
LLADNLGYGDVGRDGAADEMRGMPTPNIDQGAADGLRLNQFLVEPAYRHRRLSNDLQHRGRSP